MAHVADPDQTETHKLVGWMAGNEPTLEASAVFGRAFVHPVPLEMSQRFRRRPLSGERSCCFPSLWNLELGAWSLEFWRLDGGK